MPPRLSPLAASSRSSAFLRELGRRVAGLEFPDFQGLNYLAIVPPIETNVDREIRDPDFVSQPIRTGRPKVIGNRRLGEVDAVGGTSRTHCIPGRKDRVGLDVANVSALAT
jgi:hypothetical protein